MHSALPAAGLVRHSAWRGVWFGLLVTVTLGAAPVCAAPDTASKSGIWTLSVGSNRHECSMVLNTETAKKGLGLAMPPGCRKAVPALMPVQTWSMPNDDTVSLDDADGNSVLVFNTNETGVLNATDSHGDSLVLSRLDATHKEDGPIVSLNPVAAGYEKAKAAKAADTKTAVASASPAAPVTTTATAGNYAVLRGDRDTGCMVTLDSVARGPKGTNKARLAPACRDQGIIVFDPLGWNLQGNGLILTARKGHTVRLELNANGIWVKQPDDIKALSLKRL